MYYYQIQMQLKVYQVSYCDFVVWNKEQLLHQRIVYDSQFTEDALKKVEGIVKQCILPELVAKWFTQPTTDQISSTSSDNTLPSSTDVLLQAQSDENDDVPYSTHIDGDPTASVQGKDADGDSSVMASTSTNIETINTWCYSGQDETHDYMIGCDNEECLIQWFHLPCSYDNGQGT